MKEPLTQFGINNASSLMKAFHQVGNTALNDLLKLYSAPEDRKTLRTWGIKEASTMIGRTEQSLRTLEKEGGVFYPPLKDSRGKRYYTLNRINFIRDSLQTRLKRPLLSEPIIMAISNFKGGVAKSTTTLHLAQKCALEGLKVLCLDLDPQATLTLGFGFIPDIHLDANDTIGAALSEEPSKIKGLVKKTYFDGISIIPGNLALSDTELILSVPEKQRSLIDTLGMPHQRLQVALQHIKDDYDLIIIDCGPNLGILTINAVTAANAFLVPIPPLMSDFGSYVTFTGTLAALFYDINKEFDFFRILLTKHSGSNESIGIETLMRERFGRYMLANHIVNSVEIEKAAGRFCSVYELPKNSSDSYKRALKSLNAVFKELIDAFQAIWQAQATSKSASAIRIEKSSSIIHQE